MTFNHHCPPSGLWPRRWRQASPSNPSISTRSRCTSVTSWASPPSQLSANPSRWSTYSTTSTHSLMLSLDCMMSTRWVFIYLFLFFYILGTAQSSIACISQIYISQAFAFIPNVFLFCFLKLVINKFFLQVILNKTSFKCLSCLVFPVSMHTKIRSRILYIVDTLLPLNMIWMSEAFWYTISNIKRIPFWWWSELSKFILLN